MRTICICFILAAGPATGLAADVEVRITGAGRAETLILTTNEVSLGGENWDAADGGGSEELTVARRADRIIVTKKIDVTTGMTSELRGIEHEVTSRTIIPLERLPYSFVASGATVTVVRIGQKETINTNQATKDPGRNPADPQPRGRGP